MAVVGRPVGCPAALEKDFGCFLADRKEEESLLLNCKGFIIVFHLLLVKVFGSG
jgi:hypothetical protein